MGERCARGVAFLRCRFYAAQRVGNGGGDRGRGGLAAGLGGRIAAWFLSHEVICRPSPNGTVTGPPAQISPGERLSVGYCRASSPRRSASL
jgi:hypothetical protein